MTALTIVIPCFNEYDRFSPSDFRNFLKNDSTATLIFVNDASTDDTIEKLNTLKEEFPKKIIVLSNKINLGKAESVRYAINYGLEKNLGQSYAYLDADLATSLEECSSYKKYLNEKVQFVFASRILKVGSIVERKFSRFLFGRIIATFISRILGIKAYDTQCGCKVFTGEIAQIAFEKPFISKWLFDVEIFSLIIKKYGKETALSTMAEIPVKKWVDRGESKVKLTYFFRLWLDLYRIYNYHKNR